MANYVTKLSFAIDSWPEAALEHLEQQLSDYQHRIDAEEDDEDGDPLECLSLNWRREGATLAIWYDESPNVELLAAFIRTTMETFQLPGVVGFSWVGDCSKPRADAFDGGAVVLTKDGQRWLNLFQWLDQQLAAVTGGATLAALEHDDAVIAERDEKDPTVVITVKGGVVVDVACSIPLAVEIIDLDT